MTPDEMAQACIRALTQPEQMFRDVHVVGIAGSRKLPLPKRSFPRWKYVVNGSDGKPVYHYPAKELLQALAYHKLINLADYYREEPQNV